MNEQIKECWIKAAREDSGDKWDTQEEFIERFAKLIVRECLDIVNRHDYSYHEADPLWETAQLIKERFGVDL